MILMLVCLMLQLKLGDAGIVIIIINYIKYW